MMSTLNARHFWLDQLMLIRPLLSQREAEYLALHVKVEWLGKQNPHSFEYFTRRVFLHPNIMDWYAIETAEVVLAAAMQVLALEFVSDAKTRAVHLGFCPHTTYSPRERWRWIGAYCTRPSVLMHLEDRPKCGLCSAPMTSDSRQFPEDTAHHECRVYAEQVLAPAIRAARAARTEEAPANA